MQTSPKLKLPAYIEKRASRICVKSKRRRNLFKKAMELRSMCGLELLLVVKDAESNKTHVYNSSEKCFSADLLYQLLDKS